MLNVAHIQLPTFVNQLNKREGHPRREPRVSCMNMYADSKSSIKKAALMIYVCISDLKRMTLHEKKVLKGLSQNCS